MVYTALAQAPNFIELLQKVVWSVLGPCWGWDLQGIPGAGGSSWWQPRLSIWLKGEVRGAHCWHRQGRGWEGREEGTVFP